MLGVLPAAAMNTPTGTTRRTRAEWVCWACAVTGLALAAFPFLGGEALGSGRYALVLLGLLVGISAVVVIPLFRTRARVAEGLGTEESLLARWTLTAEEWNSWIREDLERERRAKWRTWRVIFGFSLLIGGFFAVMDREAGPVVLAALLGLCALLAGVVLLSLRHQRRSRQQAPREVWITAEGLRLGGELHVWTGFGARLEGVSLVQGNPPCLDISYSTRAKNQRQMNSVRVPVARGAEAKAAEAVALLRQKS